MAQTGTDIPWWVAALIVPAAVALWGFTEKQLWPAIARRWQNTDAHEAAAEDDERTWRRTMEERRTASEEKQAAALESIARTQITIDFRLALIERHLALDTEPKARARGAQPT